MKKPESRSRGSSNLSDVILGGQDGLVNVLGVILGVAAASKDIRIVLAGGLAATFAESISMAAVAYTSKIAELDRFKAEIGKEGAEIETVPEEEKDEIRQLFANKGFTGKLLEDITAHITSDKKLWLQTMVREELGIVEVTKKEIYIKSLIVGGSAVVGSLIPLSPFFFLGVQTSIYASIVISGIALLLIGIYKAKATVGKPIRSGLQMVLIGLGSAIAGYLIGLLFQVR